MAEPINAEDIRVGDLIRATYHFTSHKEMYEAVVIKVTDVVEIAGWGIIGQADSYELIDRPKREFKVGDKVTGNDLLDVPEGVAYIVSLASIPHAHYYVNHEGEQAVMSGMGIDKYPASTESGESGDLEFIVQLVMDYR